MNEMLFFLTRKKKKLKQKQKMESTYLDKQSAYPFLFSKNTLALHV